MVGRCSWWSEFVVMFVQTSCCSLLRGSVCLYVIYEKFLLVLARTHHCDAADYGNKELHEKNIFIEVKRRRRIWIGHIYGIPLTSILRVAMPWTPGDKGHGGDQRRRGEDLWSGR